MCGRLHLPSDCDSRFFPLIENVTPMTLSDSDRETLLATLTSKNPEIVQARMANALLLLSEGLPAEDVAGLLYLDETTVAGWQNMFMARKPRAA